MELGIGFTDVEGLLLIAGLIFFFGFAIWQARKTNNLEEKLKSQNQEGEIQE